MEVIKNGHFIEAINKTIIDVALTWNISLKNQHPGMVVSLLVIELCYGLSIMWNTWNGICKIIFYLKNKCLLNINGKKSIFGQDIRDEIDNLNIGIV